MGAIRERCKKNPGLRKSSNGKEEKIDVSRVDVSMNGIELQDREFFAAIREGREPNASSPRCCRAIRCCLEQQLDAG